jgi:hypothetical protein
MLVISIAIEMSRFTRIGPRSRPGQGEYKDGEYLLINENVEVDSSGWRSGQQRWVDGSG